MGQFVGIPAKNKGEIDMYFVNAIKPQLSVDSAGLTPNEHFFKLHACLEPSSFAGGLAAEDRSARQVVATSPSQT
jgi:hypothetical protein